jgi:LmbE family N-acetylglucosaminyl deacetylase
MKVLVVAAHPDDEVLGCGGTMLRHVAGGDDVFIAILGEGVMARADGRNKGRVSKERDKVRDASVRVARALGAKDLFRHDFPDNRMDQVPLLDIVKVVEGVLARFRPDVIYTHYANDLNIDHAIVLRAVVTATRPLSAMMVPEIYAFEVLSSTEWAFGPSEVFKPDTFVGISNFLEKKIEVMSFYETETNPFPHPRSAEAIRALAMRRGSQSGLKSAESFMLVRKIVPEMKVG